MTTQLNAGQRLCVWLFDPNQTGDGMSIHSMHIPKRLSHIHYNRHSHPAMQPLYRVVVRGFIYCCHPLLSEANARSTNGNVSVGKLSSFASIFIFAHSLSPTFSLDGTVHDSWELFKLHWNSAHARQGFCARVCSPSFLLLSTLSEGCYIYVSFQDEVHLNKVFSDVT